MDLRGDLVLYWMIAARRRSWNAALQRAVWWALSLDKPLLVLEALRLDYPYASDRLHTYALQGMADNQQDFQRRGVSYLPYVEPLPGAGKGLLAALGRHAAIVVSDDTPVSFLPRMLATAARELAVALEVVDGNGLLPLRAVERAFSRAVDFRRTLQRLLPEHLRWFPQADCLRRLRPRPATLPVAISRRWPSADLSALLRPDGLSGLGIDHAVPAVAAPGGAHTGARRLKAFRAELPSYLATRRSDQDVPTSGLSGFLHWGHLGAHQVVAEVLAQESWTPDRLSLQCRGRREGWWGLSPPAEAFLDQLVTWRELGYNAACHLRHPSSYATLPAWARASLERHAGDARQARYSLATLAGARTADELWNAAQRQLRQDGVIHSYLRMLWGKYLIAWSPSPRLALRRAFALNDRWAIDGRDPNSISGIMWLFGRYDHPWPPEREIFGSIRYMTSRSAMGKLRLQGYLSRWASSAGP